MNDYNTPLEPRNKFNESARQHRQVGKRMLLLSWCMICFIGFVFFKWKEFQDAGAHHTTTIRTQAGVIELHIPITSGDRYEVFGKINNERVLFLIDTGATAVAIPEEVAEKAGLKKGLPIEINTAGGTKTAYLTKIATLVIDNDIVLNNVIATINPDMPSSTILLGMGALKQLGFAHHDNELILIQK